MRSMNDATSLVAPAMAMMIAGLLFGRSDGAAFGLSAQYYAGFAFGLAIVLLVTATVAAAARDRRER